MSFSAPFSEEVLSYSVGAFPFYEHVRSILFDDHRDEAIDLPLELAHELPVFRPRSRRNRNATKVKKSTGLIQHDGFRNVYHEFIRDFVRSHLREDYVIFEHNPDLRLHPAGGKAITPPHTDSQSKHSPYEINFWLPLTHAYGNNSVWTESEPGRGDFHTFEVSYGQIVRFYGNACLHYTLDNDTDFSRVSFDFRVVRLRDFARSGISARDSCTSGDRWCLFSFYDVMGPDGLVNPIDWGSVVRLAPLGESLPAAVPLRQSSLVRSSGDRQRSTSPEHLECCSIAFGSERNARRCCGRCGWIAHRSTLLQQLVYRNAAGSDVPWIAENTDMRAPWGLGCILCSKARRHGYDVQVSQSCFTEFTFGKNTHGLLVGPLFKHGNHAKRQHEDRGSETTIIGLNDEHAFACSVQDQLV